MVELRASDCSVAVVGNVGALGVTSGTTGIDSLGCLAVGYDSGVECFLSCFDILDFA